MEMSDNISWPLLRRTPEGLSISGGQAFGIAVAQGKQQPESNESDCDGGRHGAVEPGEHDVRKRK